MNKAIRILHVVPNMQHGGIENLIMNIYRNIDRNKIQFDFLVHYKERFIFDREIELLGGKIYRLSFREDKNICKYIKDLDNFFREHKEYKIVHAHMASLSYIYLGIAKKNNVPIRIIHSHGASHLKTLKGYVKNFAFKFCDKYANARLACSTESGKYLFKNKSFEFIPNAIDSDKFLYNEEQRKIIRAYLKIEENKKVIGHVGRFNLQKNHDFIIDVFKKVHDYDKNFILMLIGSGELEEKIKNKVNKLNINESVFFLGNKDDIYNYYNAMDVFIMPSFFEGLPVTGIEAQCNGLECFFSSEVTREVDITNSSHFIPLDDINQWMNKILNHNKITNKIRLSKNLLVKNSNFNIVSLAENIKKEYERMYNENN